MRLFFSALQTTPGQGEGKAHLRLADATGARNGGILRNEYDNLMNSRSLGATGGSRGEGSRSA